MESPTREENAMRSLLPCLILAFLPGLAGAQTRYLDLTNTASNSIATFAVAPAGSADFREVSLGDRPLRGGGNSVTVALDQADGGCLRDLRLVFADGRVLVQKGFDLCKSRRYYTGRLGHAKEEGSVAEALAGK
jgi:hypothetical protein